MAGAKPAYLHDVDTREYELSPKLLQKEWTPDDFETLSINRGPVCCYRKIWEGTEQETHEVVFANGPCLTRFGQPKNRDELLDWVKQEPPSAKQQRYFLANMLWNAPVGTMYRGKGAYNPWWTMMFNYDAPPDGMCVSVLRVVLYKERPEAPAVKALICQFEETFFPETARVNSMINLSPVIQFLFDAKGDMVLANQKAREKYKCNDGITLRDLLSQAVFPGGETEGDLRYREAMAAIFDEKKDCHRLTVQMMSRKRPGDRRFVMLEMWAMEDPMDGSPLMMVGMFNVTQQKHLELELQNAKDLLEKQNKSLEIANMKLEHEKAVIKDEKDEIFLEMQQLEAKLEAVINNKLIPPSQIDTDTPADKILAMIKSLLLGRQPPPGELLEMYNMVVQAQDLRAPVQLEKQLLEEGGALGAEVGLAMLQLLKGGHQARASVASRMERMRRGTDDFIAAPPSPPQESEGGIKAAAAGDAASIKKVHVADAQKDGTRTSDGTEGSALQNDQQQEGGQVLAKPAAPPSGGLNRRRSCVVMTDDDASLDLVISKTITPEMERVLQAASTSWTFSVFSMVDAGVETPMSMLSFYLLKTSGLVDEMRLDEIKLSRFLRRIEEGYEDANPYHNKIHAATVVHQMHMMVQHCGLRQVGVVDSLTQLGCYMAAACHDYEHRGVNNDFLVKTHDPLAILYNDASPLENHHLAAAFRLLMQPGFNFVGGLRPEQQQRLRAMIIDTVLATDMKRHFNITSRFQEVFRPFKQASLLASHTGEPDPTLWENLREEDRSLARQVALKCADIGHLAGQWPVHQRWAGLLEEEFYLQGDRERKAGLTVSPLMDRLSNVGISKSQVGFFNIVGIPLFQAFADVFSPSQPLLNSVVHNYHQWEQVANPRKTPSGEPGGANRRTSNGSNPRTSGG